MLQAGYSSWSSNGRSLTQDDVVMQMYRLAPVLEALDLVHVDRRSWSAGPAALTLLSRATALAQIWTNGRHNIPAR